VTADMAKERLGRGEHARQRVLQAALDVLADDGMPGFSMEAVARRAGASKPTLYRRWNSASALLVDAMDAQFRPLPDVDTGDLRADLITLLTGFVSSLTDTRFPRLLAAFIDAAERAPALAELHGRLTDRRREPLARVLALAVQRGEVGPAVDVDLVVDQLAAPFFYRRFVAHRPIPTDMPAAVVDAVLAAYRR
jgi:AcrR family transcriptional regulator